jgi:hypothetical protein
VPDEHSHAIRATSVIRGQILGEDTTTDAVTEVRAPALYGQLGERVNCFSFKPNVTPVCMGDFDGSHRFIPTHTYVGRYNPLYYAVVGIPSLFSTDDAGVYAMRLLSAAISAVLVTLAVLAARQAPRPWLALLGIAFALTPMTLFLGGAINPNGMEIAGAICLWTAGLLALDPRYRRTSLIVYAVIGAGAMVMARGLSPFWLASILGLMAIAAIKNPRRTILGDRRMVVAGAIVGLGALAALVWIALTGALAVLPVGQKVSGSFLHVVIEILGHTRRQLEEMVGWLQYFDVRMPFVTYAVWFVGLGALVLLAVATGSRRVSLAVLLCLAMSVLAPLLELPSVRTTGLIWQGRYTLPLAVGVPILATYALLAAGEEVAAVLRRLALLLVAGIGGALVASFYWAGRRNAVGLDGVFVYFGREEWHTPLPAWLLMVTFTAGVGALVTLFWRSTAVAEAAPGPERPGQSGERGPERPGQSGERGPEA